MPVQISSLRVTADLDTSKYVSGMQAKIAADAAGAQSSQAVGAAVSQTTTKIADSGGVVGKLSRQYVDGYASAQKFNQAIRDLGRGIETGNVSMAQVSIILEGIYRKYGLAADATEIASKGQLDLAQAVSVLNNKYGAQNELLERAQRAQAQLNEAQAAQAAINARLNVRDILPGGAQASAEAFTAQYGGLDEIARQKADETARAFWDSFDRSVGIGAKATSSGATYSALNDLLSRNEEILKAKAQQDSINAQQAIASAYGIDAQAKSARESAAVFEEAARAQDEMAASAEALRQQINPLGAAQVRLWQETAQYQKMLDAGALSQDEFSKAMALAQERFHLTEVALKGVGGGARLTSGEIANLGYQLNDIVTGVLLGQSPFMILAQQGGQVYGILQNSRVAAGGFGEALKALGGWLLGLLTPTNLVIGAIAGIGIAAVTSASRWLESQRDITLALSGIGRASGTTVEQINVIADQASAYNKLSVSEARDVASQLAGTGKIGAENIQQLTALAYDFSRTFGGSVGEAGKALAKAFSDPAKGAEELNARLGFMDAAMQRQIANLEAQNKRYEAQKILIDAVRGSLANADQVTGFWARTWNVISNAASNAADVAGRELARITGVGQTLQEQLTSAQAKLIALQNAPGANRVNLSGQNVRGNQIAQATADIERLTKAIAENEAAAKKAADAIESIKADQALQAVLPELKARDALKNVQILIDDLGQKPALMIALGLTDEQLALARGRADEAARSFKSTIERTVAESKIAIESIPARSPSERANIARRQAELQYAGTNTSPEEKAQLAGLAADRARLEVVNQLNEAQKARILSAKDQVGSAQLDIQLIGQTAGESARLQANWQAYMDLRREASVNHTAFDEAQYQRLQKLNDQLARTKQLAAESKLWDEIRFDRAQFGRTDIEASSAARLRSAGVDINSPEGQALDQQLKYNDALKQTRDLSLDLASGGMKDFKNTLIETGDAWQALSTLAGNALNKIADKLIDMEAQNLVAKAFGGSTSWLGSLFGVSSPGANLADINTFVGPKAKGDVFMGGINGYSNTVVDHPTMFAFARGAGLMGEAGPEAIMPLRRGPDGSLGVVSHGGASSLSVSIGGHTIVVQGDASEKTIGLIKSALEEYDRSLSPKVISAVRDAHSRAVDLQ